MHFKKWYQDLIDIIAASPSSDKGGTPSTKSPSTPPGGVPPPSQHSGAYSLPAWFFASISMLAVSITFKLLWFQFQSQEKTFGLDTSFLSSFSQNMCNKTHFLSDNYINYYTLFFYRLLILLRMHDMKLRFHVIIIIFFQEK